MVKNSFVLLLKNVDVRALYNNMCSSLKPQNTSKTKTSSVNNLPKRIPTIDTPDINNTDNMVTMSDYVNFGCLPIYSSMRCFHDHHTFDDAPVGIPIKYNPTKRTENSGINDYYETWGNFCSFSCCLAYIRKHKHVNDMFANSEPLLYSMYNDIYNAEMDITAAPSFELLKDYGGKVTIDEFRKGFLKYTLTPEIKRPYMVSVGKYIDIADTGEY